jgi:hypothetical protein
VCLSRGTLPFFFFGTHASSRSVGSYILAPPQTPFVTVIFGLSRPQPLTDHGVGL